MGDLGYLHDILVDHHMVAFGEDWDVEANSNEEGVRNWDWLLGEMQMAG